MKKNVFLVHFFSALSLDLPSKKFFFCCVVTEPPLRLKKNLAHLDDEKKWENVTISLFLLTIIALKKKKILQVKQWNWDKKNCLLTFLKGNSCWTKTFSCRVMVKKKRRTYSKNRTFQRPSKCIGASNFNLIFKQASRGFKFVCRAFIKIQDF